MAQKIAFITGGNRGLGFQTALGLKDHGVKTVIGSRDRAQGEKAVEKLRAAGADAEVLEFDITKPGDAEKAYAYFDSRYGRLDILVNNAGIAAGTFPGTGPAHSAGEVPGELLHRVFETNFFAPGGAHRCVAAADPQERSGKNRQPVEHSWLAQAAGRPSVAHLSRQVVCVRRVEDGIERLYDSPGV